MVTFLIQTINGEVLHDFSFQLRESIKYNNWLNNDNYYSEVLSDQPNYDQAVPVGSIEFVLGYIQKYHGVDSNRLKPIQIPKPLFRHKYLKRKAELVQTGQVVVEDEPLFIKSIDRYKGITNIVYVDTTVPEGKYFVSEVVEIESEWRVFVFNGELVGVQNYLGDFTIFPDIQFINEMIGSYTDSPPAYTLDVGINKQGTFLVEVHPFFSCGLYGFHNYKILATMFSQTFNWLIEKR